MTDIDLLHPKLPSPTKRRNLKVDRYLVKSILRRHNSKAKEKEICDIIDRSPQCYWERFKKNKWDSEKIYALCYVLSIITGDMITPRMIIKDQDKDKE